MKTKQNKIVAFMTVNTFLCAYVLPVRLFTSLPIIKVWFLLCTIIIFIPFIKCLKKYEIIYSFLLGILVVLNHSLNMAVLFNVIPLCHFLENDYYKKELKKNLYRTKMIPISILALIIYSIFYYNGEDIIHGNEIDINTVGFSILCLGMIEYKRNKWIGRLVLISGIFTFSRNYLLALVVILFFAAYPLKKVIKKINLWKWCDFFQIMLWSSVFLLGIGLAFEQFYKAGYIKEIAWEGVQRLFKLIDKSNYLRFTVNINTILIIIKYPSVLIRGISLEKFRGICKGLAIERKQMYVGNTPHNFVFSNLRLYGFFIFVNIFFISRMLKKIINLDNYNLFLALTLFPIFLSIGFNSYWLYISTFTLLMYTKD